MLDSGVSHLHMEGVAGNEQLFLVVSAGEVPVDSANSFFIGSGELIEGAVLLIIVCNTCLSRFSASAEYLAPLAVPTALLLSHVLLVCAERHRQRCGGDKHFRMLECKRTGAESSHGISCDRSVLPVRNGPVGIVNERNEFIDKHVHVRVSASDAVAVIRLVAGREHVNHIP